MSYKKEYKNYGLMNDLVVRPLLKNSPVAHELVSRIISEVINIPYDEIYHNLKYINDDRLFSSKIVDAKTDVMLETKKYFINIEICYTNGNTRNRQMDTYNYELYLSQAYKTSDYNNMKQIIQIMIENYDYFGNDEFKYEVVFMEKNLHLTEDNFITKYHINLALLKKVSYNSIRNEKDALKKILYMFVCDEENLDKAYMGDKFMENVINNAKEIAGEYKIPLYLPESKIRRLDREEAVNEGYNSGKLDGIEQKQTEMIMNMYNDSLDLNVIAKYANLSIEEVNNIIKKNKETN